MDKKLKLGILVMIISLCVLGIVKAECYFGVIGDSCGEDSKFWDTTTSLSTRNPADWETIINTKVAEDVTTNCYDIYNLKDYHRMTCDKIAGSDTETEFKQYFKTEIKDYKITEIRTITNILDVVTKTEEKEITCPKESTNDTCWETITTIEKTPFVNTIETKLSTTKSEDMDFSTSKVAYDKDEKRIYKVEWWDKEPSLISETIVEKGVRLFTAYFPQIVYYLNEWSINPTQSYNSTDANWAGQFSDTQLDADNNITLKLNAGTSSEQFTIGYDGYASYNRIAPWGDASQKTNAFNFTANVTGTLQMLQLYIQIDTGNGADMFVNVSQTTTVPNGATGLGAAIATCKIPEANVPAAWAWVNCTWVEGSTAPTLTSGLMYFFNIYSKEIDQVGLGRNDVHVASYISTYAYDGGTTPVLANYDILFRVFQNVATPSTYSGIGNFTSAGFCPNYPNTYDWNTFGFTQVDNNANTEVKFEIAHSADNSTWGDYTPIETGTDLGFADACIQYRANITTTDTSKSARLTSLYFDYLSNVAPDVSIDSPLNDTYTTQVIDINLSVQDVDGVDTIWWSNNSGADNVTFTTNLTYTFPLGEVTLWVWANDSDGMLNESFVDFVTQDLSPPTFNEISNEPPSINFSTLFENRYTAGRFYVNATITDPNVVDTTKTRIYTYVNATTLTSLCYATNNGSIAPRRCPVNYLTDTFAVNETNYEFNLSGDETFESVNNLNRDIYNTPHNTLVVDTNTRVKTRFLEVPTENIDLLMFELMADNTTALPPPLQTYACNVTYNTGQPSTSTNCISIGSFSALVPYNHEHSTYSSHRILPISIVNGKIGGILQLTSTMRFIMVANSGWNIYTAPNDTESAATGNNPMASWTNQTYTIDAHLHPYRSDDAFYYYIEACDLLGNCGNSTLIELNLTTGNIRPTAPTIFTPDPDETIREYYNITWMNSTAFEGENWINYSINLRDAGEVINMTIKDNATYNSGQDIHSYYWNTSEAGSGVYELVIRATDSLGKFTLDVIQNLTIENEAPTTPVLNAPINETKSSVIPTFQWNNATHWLGVPIVYDLQVDNDPAFTSIDFSSYDVPETANPTGVIPTGLVIDTEYYWRVASSTIYYNSSWSDVWMFNYSSFSPYAPVVQSNTSDITLNRTDADIYCIFQPISEVYSSLYANVTWWIDNINNVTYNEIPVTNGTQYVNTLSNNNTHRDNVIFCEVSIFDSYYASDPANSSSVTILNTPPTIPTTISPANETYSENVTTTLECSGSTDADLDTIYTTFYGQLDTNPPTTNLQNNTPTTYVWNLDVGNHWWYCYANDATDVSTFGETRFLYSNSEEINTNISVEPASVYEGQSSFFELNLTVNPMLVLDITSTLTLNNTEHVATKVKTNTTDYNFKVTTNAPLNILSTIDTSAYFWNLTETLANGTTNYNATFGGNLNTNLLTFDICNVTFAMPFINFTFKDEDTDAYINGTIRTGTFAFGANADYTGQKQFLFTNTTIYDSFSFCAEPNTTYLYTTYSVGFENTPDYLFRSYSQSIILSNTATNRILYLINTADAIPVTFAVVNIAGQPLAGSTIEIYRSVGGTSKLISSQLTGSDGAATFYLNPDYSHTIKVTNPSYTSSTSTIVPTQSLYTITLSNVGTSSEFNYFSGMSWKIEPVGRLLNNNTIYNFNFTLDSNVYSITEAGLYMHNGTDTLGSAVCYTPTGCVSSINIDTKDYPSVWMEYYWYVNGTYVNLTDKDWLIDDLLPLANSSMGYLIDDLSIFGKSFGDGEHGEFTKGLIAFFIILVIVGILTYTSGLYSPTAILAEVFFLSLFFTIIGFIPMVQVADWLPASAKKYFISSILGLITVGSFMYEWQRS